MGVSEKMDYRDEAKEIAENFLLGDCNAEELCAAAIMELLDKVRQAQAELARNLGRAEGRQMEFMIMKGDRPADSCYWDMHHKKELDGEVEAAKKLCIAALGRK